MTQLSHLQIRNPKDDETPIESATQIFASLLPSCIPLWKRWYLHPKTYAFEIYLIAQTLYFYVTAPKTTETFIQSLVSSSFPTSTTKKTGDPMDLIFKSKKLVVGEVALNSYSYLPTKTYFDFKDVDPLSALLGFLSKQPAHLKMAVQIAITPAYFPWADAAVSAARHLAYDETADRYGQNPQRMLIMKKASFQGGKAVVRLLVGSTQDSVDPYPYLTQLAGTFGSFSLGEGNQYGFKRRIFFKDALLKRVKNRKIAYFERQFQILNAQELATLWHPPGYLLAGIKNIAWGKTLLGEPPENLPIAHVGNDLRVVPEKGTGEHIGSSLQQYKSDVNFFAKTEFKNKEQIFGIKTEDRRKHVYIIGKTGVGKTTLIANMAIDDIRKGRGIGIIDPHGDLSETILDFIPKRRMNDVVYLEPFDTERPFS
ncbi:MAG: type IV secretory system conjugative DNA transfer family protein, partial [Candidatus Roizmanbacteria bacterium]